MVHTGQSSARLPNFEGEEFGGYRVTKEIASGGMATVYLAHKIGPGGFAQQAAIKVVHPHMAKEAQFVEMFLDEARIASSINHPNVCRVFDFGESAGTYYLAMEYILGETWSATARALEETPEGAAIMPQVLAHVLGQACEGLHAAHEAVDAESQPLNVVHRDVSPQNLLVGYDGTVRVLDFGIASAAERLHQTNTGTVKGRFRYMSPEQMGSEVVDRRADIWSVGVILREGLESRPLFKRSQQAATMLAVTHEPMPEWLDGVPDALRAVCERSVQRDRTARYDSARDMGVDLARYLHAQDSPLTAAEMSSWMQRLFAEQCAKKKLLLKRSATVARTGDFLRVDVADPTRPVDSTPPTAQERPPRPAQDDSSEDSGLSRVRPAADLLPSNAPASIGDLAWWAAAALLVGTVLGFGWFWNTHADDAPPPVVVVVREEGSGGSASVREPSTNPSPTELAAAAVDPALVAEASPSGGTDAPSPRATAKKRKNRRSGSRSADRLTRAFRARSADVQRCFETSGANTQPVSVRFWLGTSGRVSRAALKPPQLSETPMGKCLLDVARSTRFGPQPQPVSFHIPLSAAEN